MKTARDDQAIRFTEYEEEASSSVVETIRRRMSAIHANIRSRS